MIMKTLCDVSEAIIPLILYYVDEEYRHLHRDVAQKIGRNLDIWWRAVTVADQNGLLPYFCQKAADEKDGVIGAMMATVARSLNQKEGVKFRTTLDYVSSMFQNEGFDYMLIKLYRNVPVVPKDIDVLIRKDQIQDVVDAFKKKGFKVRSFSDAEVNCEKEGFLKVDLYEGFYYLNHSFLDSDFIWNNPRTVWISNVKCLIPNVEADLLSTLLHSLFGHRSMNLLDFLYAKSLLHQETLDFELMNNQANKHGWEIILKLMIDFILQNYQVMYFQSNRHFDFPLVFTAKFVLQASQQVKGTQINTRIIFASLISSLIDQFYRRYQRLQRLVPTEMSNDVGEVALRLIRMVRNRVGDRKGL